MTVNAMYLKRTVEMHELLKKKGNFFPTSAQTQGVSLN